MKSRKVFGGSDWPESHGKKFEIFAVPEGWTDEQAIAAAKKCYSQHLVCVVEEVEVPDGAT